MLLTSERILALIPGLLGLLLLILSFLDRYLFDSGLISVGTMLAIELPLVVLGLLSGAVLFCAAFFWAFGGQWKLVVGAALSIAMFFVCFVIGGVNGAAYLNAT